MAGEVGAQEVGALSVALEVRLGLILGPGEAQRGAVALHAEAVGASHSRAFGLDAAQALLEQIPAAQATRFHGRLHPVQTVFDRAFETIVDGRFLLPTIR